MVVDHRRTPLAMECLQTNLNNHSVTRTVANLGSSISNGHVTRVASLGNTVSNTLVTRVAVPVSNTVISRTILDSDRYLNRTMSLPILLEKKSVEIKPRYEAKSKTLKETQLYTDMQYTI